MSEWISVDDRVPAVGVFVLVFERYCEEPFVGRLDDGGFWCASKDFYGTSGDCVVVDNVCQSDITHWMPLPKPPKEISK